MKPIRNIAVLVSGNGSNLQAILEQHPISVVISDQPEAFALQRATKAGIPAFVFERKNFSSRTSFEAAIVAKLQEHQIELICLAGFMRIIGKTLLDAFPKRIINIHPSLLPAFPGLDAVQQALSAGATHTGCTVHLVDELMDHGPILMQAQVKVEPSDTLASVLEKVHREEHRIYPQVIAEILSGKIRLDEIA